MTTIATTPKGVPIAAWMLKANPAIYDVGGDLADAGTNAPWTWTLANSYRVGLMAPGHRCFLWVTKNANPALVSGIWVVGEVTGEARVGRGSSSPLWRDADRQRRRAPYIPLTANTLRAAVTREELLGHPGLRDLEVLRAPQMGNPQIVTPDQLALLESDFDLTTGDLSAEVRDALRSDWVHPALAVLISDDEWLELYEDHDGGFTSWRGEARESHFDTWQQAYRRCASLAASGQSPATEEGARLAIAVAKKDGSTLQIERNGSGQHVVLEVMRDDELEWADLYPDVAAAMEAIIASFEAMS